MSWFSRTVSCVPSPAAPTSRSGSAAPSVGGPEITVGSGPVAVARAGVKLTPSTTHNTKVEPDPCGFGGDGTDAEIRHPGGVARIVRVDNGRRLQR